MDDRLAVKSCHGVLSVRVILDGNIDGIESCAVTISTEFSETAVRHSRHYDVSLHFITQTGGEFALTPETRTIANLCSLTLIHRVQEETEKLAEWFGLSEREVNWIRTAKAGNDEDGFSEALLGIDEEGWFPLRIRASEFEVDQIDPADR